MEKPQRGGKVQDYTYSQWYSWMIDERPQEEKKEERVDETEIQIINHGIVNSSWVGN